MRTFAALAMMMLVTGIATAAHATGELDGAIVRNSGSTNTFAYAIKVRSDGSAQAIRSARGAESSPAPVTGKISMDLARKFFSDLRAAKSNGSVAGSNCMKSASFGSATVVQYHGWTSPDLECPGDGFVVALATEVHQIADALELRNAPVRRPLMPNEPRRPETLPTQATPSPEFSRLTP